MKNIKVALGALAMFVGSLFIAGNVLAYGSLESVSLKITPNTELSKATWVTSFTIPADTEVGHILGSMSGNPIDMSGASAVVSGLPEGYEIILKPRTTCASGCDDFRLWYQNPVKVTAGTRVTITINNIGNPGTSQTGWNYLDVFDSQYPTMHLGYSVSNKYVPLIESAPACSADTWTCGEWSACSNSNQTRSCTMITDCPSANTPQPSTSQSCYSPVAPVAPQPQPQIAPAPQPQVQPQVQPTNVNISIQQINILSITQIQINNIFLFPGSHTTNLKKVTPTEVDNFSLDKQNIGYFTFLGRNDLSSKTAIDTMSKLDDQVYFDYFYFRFEWKFWILFKTDVRCTFYDKQKQLTANSPVSVNGNVLNKDEYKIEVAKDGAKNVTVKRDVVSKYVKEGEKVEISMKPVLTLNITDKSTINSETNKFLLTGTSTAGSKIFVNFNGEKIELALDEKGAFQKTFTLEPGSNSMKVMAYTGENKEPYSTVESTVEYKESKASTFWQTIVGIGLLVGLAGVFFLKNSQRQGSGATPSQTN